MRHYLILLFVVSICLQSCFNNSGNSVTERKVVLEDSTSFYAISVTYPLDRKDAEGVMKKFASERFDEKREEWKTGGEIHKEELLLTKEFPDRTVIKYTYDLDFKGEIADSLGITSYLFTTYEYTGGANGNTTVNSFAFTKDKKQLHIQDILSFEDNKDIELSKLIATTALSDTTLFFKDFVYDGLGLSYLKSDGVTLDKAKCECDGFFFGSNMQNFVVKNSGIQFYFSKYAIAPGVAGVTSVFLTWEQLKMYLNPKFRIQ